MSDFEQFAEEKILKICRNQKPGWCMRIRSNGDKVIVNNLQIGSPFIVKNSTWVGVLDDLIQIGINLA